MDANELRAMAQKIVDAHKQSEHWNGYLTDGPITKELVHAATAKTALLIEHGVDLAAALLARLDAEDAHEKYRVQLHPLNGGGWFACSSRNGTVFDAEASTAALAVAACVAKIKTLTPKEQP